MSKERYIWLDGKYISVNEVVYRAFYRPLWREAKRKKAHSDKECSYEQMLENGYDLQSNIDIVEDIVADKQLLNELYAALAELSEDERSLIDALYFIGKSERIIAAEKGVQRNTIVYHKIKILGKLKKILSNL